MGSPAGSGGGYGTSERQRSASGLQPVQAGAGAPELCSQGLGEGKKPVQGVHHRHLSVQNPEDTGLTWLVRCCEKCPRKLLGGNCVSFLLPWDCVPWGPGHTLEPPSSLAETTAVSTMPRGPTFPDTEGFPGTQDFQG